MGISQLELALDIGIKSVAFTRIVNVVAMASTLILSIFKKFAKP